MFDFLPALNPHDVISKHGDWFYLITFIWTALEGETFIIFAALAAQRGLLDIHWLFLAAWVGSFCGDQMFFYLGRRYGTRILTKFPRLLPRLNKVFAWLEKYAVIFILSYRFMYGIRNISGLAVGMSHLPWRKFMGLNLIASFIWATIFCGTGYLFGDVLQSLGRHKEEIVTYNVREAMLITLAVFAVVIIAKLIHIRHKQRRLAHEIRVDQQVPPNDPPLL